MLDFPVRSTATARARYVSTVPSIRTEEDQLAEDMQEDKLEADDAEYMNYW